MLGRLLAALLIAFAPASAALSIAAPVAAQAEIFPISEMMRATALDEVFSQFGASVIASARGQDIAADANFLRHWDDAAARIFNADALHDKLARQLDGQFTLNEQGELGRFFRSDFGTAITTLEREAARLAPEAQTAAIAQGEAIAASASAIRAAQLDEMMEQISAEIAAAMVAQSMRALLLGFSVSQQRGEIEVPWAEIDAQVEAMLPGMIADVTRAQRAMMAYAYRELADGELERYLVFLRTEPAKKFYALAAIAIGKIVNQGMSQFGETLAARLASVNI